MPWVARRHIQALNNNLMIPSDSFQVFEHKFHVVQIQIPPSDRACGNGSEAVSKWNVKFTNKKLNAQALMWNSMVSCFTTKINNHSNFLLFLFSSTLCLTETTCKSDDGSVKNFFQEPPRGGYAILDHCIIHSKCTLSSSHFSSFFQAAVRLLFIVNNPARDSVSAHILHHSRAPFPHWFLLLSGRAQESPLAVFFFEWGDSTPRKKCTVNLLQQCKRSRQMLFHYTSLAECAQRAVQHKVARFLFSCSAGPFGRSLRDLRCVARADDQFLLRFRKDRSFARLSRTELKIYDHSCSNWHFSLHIQSLHREWVSAREPHSKFIWSMETLNFFFTLY